MKPIVLRGAGADEIARAWSGLRNVDRQRKGGEVLLDVSALTEASAAFEAFVVALDRHAAARELTRDAAPVSSGSSGSALPIIGAILILLLLGAAAWYLYSSWSSVPEAPLPTPIQTIEPASPTVSNEAELDIEVVDLDELDLEQLLERVR